MKASRYEVEHIKALGLPEQDAKSASELIGYLDKTLIPIEARVTAAAAHGDVAAFHSAYKALTNSGSALGPLEKHFDFKVCGK